MADVVVVESDAQIVEISDDGITVATVGIQGPQGPAGEQGEQGEPGASGTSDHAALDNLAYADSGHTGFAGTGVANTFTAAQTIDMGAVAGAPLLLQTSTWEGSGNAIELRDSTDTLRLRLLDNGTFVWPSVGNLEGSQGFIYSVGTVARARIGSDGQFAIGNNINPTGSYQLIIRANNHTDWTTLILQANTSQTADLQQWQDANGVALAKVDVKGGIILASMADASANNSTLYYSTDAAKPVYKDSSGVVNPLY